MYIITVARRSRPKSDRPKQLKTLTTETVVRKIAGLKVAGAERAHRFCFLKAVLTDRGKSGKLNFLAQNELSRETRRLEL